jgi:hypothetical protein
MNGIDVFVGRNVPLMPRKVRLIDIRMDPQVHACPQDHGHRTKLAHFVENLRDRLLAQKIIGDAEVNDSVSESKRHIDDPCTMVLGGIFFQVGSPSRAITKTEHETREVSSEPERQPSRNVINVLPRGRLFQESSSEEV